MASGSPDEASEDGAVEDGAVEDDTAEDDTAENGASEDGATDGVRVWLVERTYSDDEQNLIILTYATEDGRQYVRKERALTSFSDRHETSVSVVADPDDLGSVDDPETVEWYADEAASVAKEHGPDGTL